MREVLPSRGLLSKTQMHRECTKTGVYARKISVAHGPPTKTKMTSNNPQNYVLYQRGRARVDFLIDLGIQGQALEQQADAFAETQGLTQPTGKPDLTTLQQEYGPIMQSCEIL